MDKRCGNSRRSPAWGPKASRTLDDLWTSQRITLENPQGRAYNRYINSVMFTMSTYFKYYIFEDLEMPRHIDPEVEGRILEAARKLWRKGGEKSLSMRAVAKLAGTNTPAVYRRFRTREDILKALVHSYQQELYQIIESCHSLQEVVHRYLDFALSRQREYQLVMSGLLPRMTKGRPSLELAVRRSAEWLGKPSADYRGLVLVLAAMVDGAAMFKATGFLSDENFESLRSAFGKAVDVLVANSEVFRSAKPRS